MQTQEPSTALQIVELIRAYIFQPIASLLFALGFLFFMWGLVVFIASPADSERRSIGKRHMGYGILGLLIMVSVWGIMGMVTSFLHIDCQKTEYGYVCE